LETDVNWDSGTHFKNMFFVFLRRFRLILALKSAKSANISQKMLLKIRNGYRKTQNSMLEFESVEKCAKKFTPKNS
jgi:hypothetical protein